MRGARVLDLGTGPGVIALELAARGASVVGIDISENQIAAARELAQARGLASACRFEVGSAEESKQPDASFDLVTAGTCWHWFDHARALAEMARVLAPGGLLAIVNYTYLPQHSALVRESEALVVKWNPSLEAGRLQRAVSVARRQGPRSTPRSGCASSSASTTNAR